MPGESLKHLKRVIGLPDVVFGFLTNKACTVGGCGLMPGMEN